MKRRTPYIAVKLWLVLRNIATTVATVLFLSSIFFHHYGGLKFAAYLCGMAAYGFEFLVLTDGLHRKIPHEELYMVYCFAPLYLLLGISYLLQ